MGGMKEPEKFFHAMKEFRSIHGCVIRPVPAEYWFVLDQVSGSNGDPSVTFAP